MKNQPRVYMLIGLPGSGKTHWMLNKLADYPNCNVWSLNFLRYQFASTRIRGLPVLNMRQEPNAEQYTQIWGLCKDRGRHFGEFSERALYARLQELNRGYPLFIDNMNLYAAKREKLIGRFRSYGARVTGVLMDTQLELCIERQQKTRGIAREDMEQMFISMDIPTATEFDEFIVV